MCKAEIPNSTFGEEIQDPSVLIDYIRTQFESAYQKEGAMDQHTGETKNGSFYKQVPIPGITEHELVRGSTKIVLKPPFSTLIRSNRDEFAEVFAVYLRGEDGHIVGDDAGYFADQYLVRLFSQGRYGDYELVTEDGVFKAEVERFDPIAGFGTSESPAVSVEEEIAEAMRPITRAGELLSLISGYNIVATND